MKKFSPIVAGCFSLVFLFFATTLCKLGAQTPPGVVFSADSRCQPGMLCNGVIDACTWTPNTFWFGGKAGGRCWSCVSNGVLNSFCLEDDNFDCGIDTSIAPVACANAIPAKCVANATNTGAVCVAVPGNPTVGPCILQQCIGSRPQAN